MKIRKLLVLFLLIIPFAMGFEIPKEEIITMYSLDGRTQLVEKNLIEEKRAVGWFLEPVIQLYSADGRTEIIEQTKAEEQLTVGWYLEPVIQLYSLDGRIEIVKQTEVEAQLTVGWYLEPMTMIYNKDGSTLIIESDEIQNYVDNKTWFLNKEDIPIEEKRIFLGTFKLTTYSTSLAENGGNTHTAGGQLIYDVVNICIAVDPKVIPLGSRVYIEGVGERVAMDTGGVIKGNKIDILVGKGANVYATNLNQKAAKVYLLKK